MANQDGERLFLDLLKRFYAWEQQLAQVVEQWSQRVQDPDVKHILSARAHLTRADASAIEKCFELLGTSLSQLTTRFSHIWAEEAQREFEEWPDPVFQALYALKTIRTAQQALIGEYAALTAIAEAAGNAAVTTLLHHNLADKVDFIERTRQMFLNLIRLVMVAELAGEPTWLADEDALSAQAQPL